MKAYAKINLGLTIYKNMFREQKHKIRSIFILDKTYYDELKFAPSDDCLEVIYYIDNRRMMINDDIVLKSLLHINKKYQLPINYHIRIDKHIPLGAGLGGGSSDAACAILKVLADNDFDLEKLDMRDIASVLGSDIPFFLFQYQIGLVSDIGNVVLELNESIIPKYKIILNDFNISTREIYQQFDRISKVIPQTNYEQMIDHLKRKKPLLIHNGLQPICFKLNMQLEKRFKELTRDDSYLFLTGSGSAMIEIPKEGY